MKNSTYTRATEVDVAVQSINDGARFVAGGTNLLDLMKENVMKRSALVDVSRIPMNAIEETEQGGLRLAAFTTNAKTARSQIIGGVVWGISQALEEDTVMDHNVVRFMNHDLAEYHVPVNADINQIDVIFVEEIDGLINPLGVKGLGEIGLVGVAGAIANAVFHATGKRWRNLPIHLDHVM